MNHKSINLKLSIFATFTFVLISILLLWGVINTIWLRSERVLSDSVDIYASVGACILNFRVRPDERTFLNWGTYIEVDVINSSNINLGTFVGTTNSNGELTVNLCTSGIYAYTPGIYTFNVKGVSHLTESIPYYFPAIQSQTIDLSTTSQRLTPGDINGTSFSNRDDEVNSLDMAHIIAGFGKNYGDIGYVAEDDLNYDQKIDYTDLQIMIKNTYLSPAHNDSLYDYPISCL